MVTFAKIRPEKAKDPKPLVQGQQNATAKKRLLR